MNSKLFLLTLILALILSCKNESGTIQENQAPRLIISTDIGGDPDDQQSLIRLLLYSNELDIEGIIASASGTRGELGVDTVKSQLIVQTIEAYSKVYQSLKKHSGKYPEPDYLLSVVKKGNPKRGIDFIGEEMDTEGSEHIISVVDKEDSRKVNIAIWGGQTDLVQALWKVKNNRTRDDYLKFVAKIRIYDINDQDGIYPFIRNEFPELFYVLSKAPEGVDKREGAYRGMYLGGDEDLTSKDWIVSHVASDHGPLGELYPLNTWTAPNPYGVMKEGDSPSWFYFLENGIQDSDHPEWGGWGGRFSADSANFYKDAEDFGLDGVHARATVYRWRQHFQNDFAAKMDWCISDFASANHRPLIIIPGFSGHDPFVMDVQEGDWITLDAGNSFDPDDDQLDFFWWTYPEAGTNEICPELENYLSNEVSFTVPVGESGREIHMILEVSDNGIPALTALQRLIFRIN